jgi:hypothetical protein
MCSKHIGFAKRAAEITNEAHGMYSGSATGQSPLRGRTRPLEDTPRQYIIQGALFVEPSRQVAADVAASAEIPKEHVPRPTRTVPDSVTGAAPPEGVRSMLWVASQSADDACGRAQSTTAHL